MSPEISFELMQEILSQEEEGDLSIVRGITGPETGELYFHLPSGDIRRIINYEKDPEHPDYIRLFTEDPETGNIEGTFYGNIHDLTGLIIENGRYLCSGPEDLWLDDPVKEIIRRGVEEVWDKEGNFNIIVTDQGFEID
jgi:hypothetical protein